MRRHVAAVLFTTLPLVGCTPAGSPPAPSLSPSVSSPTATASPASTAGASAGSGRVVWSDGATGAAPTPGRLRLDDASRDQAIRLAVQALALYARPDATYDQWWADLQPLLSAQATMAYSTVDPGNIPVRAVTGTADLPGWDTPEVARVTVPTDVGAYLVVVSRSDADPVWRVERFVAPEVLS